MVKVEKFNIERDYAMLADWMFKRQLRVPELWEMPKVGKIILWDDTPVSIGFIRQVEGGFGQFDSWVTNPAMPKEIRHKCNTILTEELEKSAKELNLKAIYAYSSDTNTLVRAVNHGFSMSEGVFISKKLNYSKGLIN